MNEHATAIQVCGDTVDFEVRPKTLALGRSEANFYRSIRSILHHFGDLEYRHEKAFETPGSVVNFVRSRNITRVLMPNPYGNSLRLACYRELRAAGIVVVASDRGALPDSWFFDHGFNYDSPSYREAAWDHPLSKKARGKVDAYLKELRESDHASETQGPRAQNARHALELPPGKVLFVPLQRLHDTVVRYFSGAAGSLEGLVRFADQVLELLDSQGDTSWHVVLKKHPLEDERLLPRHRRVRYAPDATHVYDLLELSDAVMVLNSGVGLISLCFGKPTINVGDAFYSHPGLSKHVETPEEAAAALSALVPPDSERVARFIHHLINRIYSFAKVETQVTRTKHGDKQRITRHLEFRELRILGKEHNVGGARMLLVSPVIPSLIYRGSQLRAAEMIRALIALGCRVSLAVLNNSLRERPSREIARELRAEFPSVESIEVLRHPRFNTGVIGRTQRFGLLVADEITAGRHRISNLDSCPPNLRRVVAQMCKELRPRFLLVNYAKLAPVVPADFEGIAILDTHDYQTQLLKEDQEVNRVRRIINRHIYQLTEHAALKRFDRIIAINPNEEQTFREIVPSTPTFFVPAFCRPAYIDSKIFWSFPYDALFVGSMSTHNVRSLLWFAQSVLPMLRKRRPNFRMAVVGNIIRAKKLQGRSFAGVEYLGVVPNLRESYETARCVIAPILGGAGMKIKVIEALGHGKAVVATSRALDGIRAKHGEHIIREDRPQDFAEAVLRIAEDNELRHRLERGARELHARDHSFAAITDTLRKVTE